MMANILVTSASTGIGRATVSHLVGNGHTVFAGVRKQTDADSLTNDLGSGVVPVLVDVTDPAQVAGLGLKMADRLAGDGLHGLVNNAGIAVGGPLEHLPIEVLRRQLEVNVVAQVAVTQALMPAIRRATGRIVFIGSLAGRLGAPMLGAYSASKHALEGLTESLRAELAPWGIRVVLVEPGSIKTEIWAKGHDQVNELEKQFDPAVVSQYRAHIDMAGRLIDHQDKIGIPAIKVARVVERALFTKRPSSRYQVGLDSKAVSIMSRLLPDEAKAAAAGLIGGTRLPKA